MLSIKNKTIFSTVLFLGKSIRAHLVENRGDGGGVVSLAPAHSYQVADLGPG